MSTASATITAENAAEALAAAEARADAAYDAAEAVDFRDEELIAVAEAALRNLKVVQVLVARVRATAQDAR